MLLLLRQPRLSAACDAQVAVVCLKKGQAPLNLALSVALLSRISLY